LPIDHQYLVNNFDYDKKTGTLKPKNNALNLILRDRNGYKYMYLEKKDRPYHRLVYLFHNEELPDGNTIDHINRDRSDNRIENLRAVSPLWQAHNRGTNVVHNNWNVYVANDGRKNKYRGAISFKGKKYYIKGRETKEEAQKDLITLHNRLMEQNKEYRTIHTTALN